MKKLASVLLSSLVLFSSAAISEITEQYDSLEELIHEHSDYYSDNNTFELYSYEPLEFRLSKASIKGEPEEVTSYENWRAAIYGVYNTFAHTSIDAVTVTAIPLWRESFMSNESRLLEDEAVTLSMNRQEALAALRHVGDFSSLHDVKTKGDYGYQWSDSFIDIYYEDRAPGLDAFIDALSDYRVY